MFRVPSTSGIPVAFRSRDGPSALMTASAPWTAAAIASRSLSFAATTVRRGSLTGSLSGERTTATTSRPRASACSTTRRPTPPEAPNTTTRLAVVLASVMGECLSDDREDLGAEQLDPAQDVALRHAADVHLEDLARVAEQAVKMQDPLGDLPGAPDEDHAAALVGGCAFDPCRRRTAQLGHALLEHPALVLEVGLPGEVVGLGHEAVHRDRDVRGLGRM